ncbi:histidine kinase [Mycobacterium sp. djl-10]|nr:histidine kinase [Mycobacterium sp. djl-10]
MGDSCADRADVPSSPALERSVLMAVPQPVFVVDPHGRVLFANPAAAWGFGLQRPDQMLGRSSHATWHYRRPDGSGYPTTACPLLTAARKGVAARGADEWFIRADGTMFPATWHCAPLDVLGGRGAVFSFTDLTEQRAVEEASWAREAADIRAAEAVAAQRRILEASATARQHLARDLHDGAQQRLINLLIQLQLTREQLASQGPVDDLLAGAIAEAKSAVGDLRELAAGIHPSLLRSRGLLPAVRALSTRTVVMTTVAGQIRCAVAPEVESSAYFLIAEALTNVVKHACASTAHITIDGDEHRLRVTVEDDGVGGAVVGRGSGLVGIADRVRALDGTVRIDSVVGEGTAIEAVLPVRVTSSEVADD